MAREPSLGELKDEAKRNPGMLVALGLAIGAGLGVVAGAFIGALTGDVGFWISMGVAFGAGIGLVIVLIGLGLTQAAREKSREP